MLLGYKVIELKLKAMYDDGTPAEGVKISILKGEQKIPIYNGTTNDSGELLFFPEGDLGALSFVCSAGGHRAELKVDLEQEETGAAMPLAAKVAAGLGYLLGAAGLSMIYVAHKKSGMAKP
ncbi:Uncharacterised protein [uncultured archaeon]|nr:Uncharacterised protein [uncultured archaeon]